MEILNNEKPRVAKGLFILIIILSAYFAVKIVTEVKSYQFIGGGTPATNTISFDGTGDVTAAPDLATISFTLQDTEKDVKTAQDKVTAKETAVLAFLDSQKIAKTDIKTENYNSFPQYQFLNSVCASSGAGIISSPNTPSIAPAPIFCPPGKQVITGYIVSENISVKIHDITKAGSIVQGIGAVGVNDMNGPNFSIENEDNLKEQARKIAIDDAKAKAKSLSADLGVNLIRIVNFSENGNNPPIFFAQGLAAKADSAAVAPTPAPALPTGENKITSNVTITYEIR
jgi:uncharacterized protein YggE